MLLLQGQEGGERGEIEEEDVEDHLPGRRRVELGGEEPGGAQGEEEEEEVGEGLGGAARVLAELVLCFLGVCLLCVVGGWLRPVSRSVGARPTGLDDR